MTTIPKMIPDTPNRTVKVAVLGSGNIGSDLMYKLLKRPKQMSLALMAGIDPASEGLARARSLGIPTSTKGADAILAEPEIKIVFDATSAPAHRRHAAALENAGKLVIDLTPAARGPYVVPPVNLGANLDCCNVNLITCGGQATIPLVHAVSRVTRVEYAEMVSTVASQSAGPGTRQNIDEFTYTTARGLEVIGGAARGKAIIVLNPADPPLLMRNTVYILPDSATVDEAAIKLSVEQMVGDVQQYVPGYRLSNPPIFESRKTPWGNRIVLTLLLVVEGAGDYLPVYAGNLDIMTSSACRVGELFAEHMLNPQTKEEVA